MRFKKEWYGLIKLVDRDWRDIEYGLENPERIYQPVAVSSIDPFATEYYDRVLEVWHAWEAEGRRRRDCVVAELLGSQYGNTGTEQGISEVLRKRRLKPNSRGSVRRTIAEINAIVSKKAQRHLVVEQAIALLPLDSKPTKDDADGKTETDSPTSITTIISLRTAA